MLSRIALKPVRSAIQPIRMTQTSATSNAASAATTESPERDLVNFPRPVRQEYPGKVRMGFIPDEWFQFFYSKTGVTGPYTFGLGLATYLCSKEIYIMEHEFYTGLSIAIMGIYAVKKLGPATAKFLDAEVAKSDAEMNAGRDMAIAEAKARIAAEKVEQDRALGMKMLFDAKRENVALQLEAAYREQLVKVFSETKKRLDYQVEVQNVQRNLEQRHVVDWVLRSVRAAVTPEQEKATLSQCIANIKSLAQQNTVRI
ncbi:ATP synthase subunit b, mitochondrial-like [Daphnia pulex]|uniref:ATP synthase subunit b, mitochondrial-like n=1 Tax=Daphnia pulex TaxID=6669 RepID=UPI001EDF7E9A|nr:ATP synthase subunit b, mitochondrial-like [Daphnia pulex]XP_046634118.1 ATP synthase subunit b, mitochondrial-like [Daphnia pulicaria]